MINGPQREAIKLTQEEARMVERLRQYRMDKGLYSKQCLKVVAKDSSLVPLVFNEPQLLIDAKLAVQEQEHGLVRAIMLKGRKQGASTYVASRFYHKTRLYKHRNAKVMAHVQSSTDALFAMVQTLYDNDPLRLRADRSNAKQFKFSNGSSYTVATAGGSGEAGRGDTPTLAHLSEVAFYKNAEKNFAGFANSVPMATGTEVIVESTANGLGNEFHRRWMRAEAGLADVGQVSYIPIFIPWFISSEYRLPAPSGFTLRTDVEGDGLPSERDVAEMYGLDADQMAWRRFMIDDSLGSVETFMQEYPCNPTEAFQTPGVDLFIKPIYVTRARRRRDIQPHGPKILGVDPAGMGGDKFCMTLRQGMVVHWHKGRPGVEPGEEQVEWVASIMMEEGVARCNIDYSGGWGSSLLAGLRERYPKLAEKCYPVDFGGKSQFKMIKPHAPGPRNRRAEMYTRARDWFQSPEGCMIPDEDELQSDLGAITARIAGQSTDTLIEAKSEIKKLLGRSPDTSDSFVLTFAVPDRVIGGPLTRETEGAISKFNEGVPRESHVDAYNDAWSIGQGLQTDSGGGWMT